MPSLKEKLRSISFTPPDETVFDKWGETSHAREYNKTRIKKLLFVTIGEVTFIRYDDSDMLAVSIITGFELIKGRVFICTPKSQYPLDYEYANALAFVLGFSDSLVWEVQ